MVIKVGVPVRDSKYYWISEQSSRSSSSAPFKFINLFANSATMNLVQYVILRKDLQTVLNWPLGAIIAQGCHASVAAVGKFWADESTKSYVADLERMHKVVLEVGDEAGLKATAAALSSAGIDHVLWTEQPEGIPTAVATKPGLQKELKPILRHLKLFS